MNAPKIHVLSAPKDEFLADLERFSVPFGVEICGRRVLSPPEAWERVFNGPHGADGKSMNCGGLRSCDVSAMRQAAATTSGTLPACANGCFPDQRYSAAATAPPAREPVADTARYDNGARAPMEKALQ